MVSTSAVRRSSRRKSPNWLKMPDKLMSNIFQRLDVEEILSSTWKVCTTWRRICKDPAMWKVIDLSHRFQVVAPSNYSLEMLTKQAVNLSCGELIDITIGYFCTDVLLHHIVLKSSKLKRLFLWHCRSMTGSALTWAVKRLPQLEELRLDNIDIKAKDFEVIGRNCRQLKSLKISALSPTSGSYAQCDDQAVAIANSMPALLHLEIFGDEMTDTGVQAILNGCPHLQSLDILMVGSFDLDENLVESCMERIKDFTHNANRMSDDDFDDMYSSGSDGDESFEADD